MDWTGLYKDVMETAVCKLQEEMHRLAKERDSARKEHRQAQLQSRRNKREAMDKQKEILALRKQSKLDAEERSTLEKSIDALASKSTAKAK